jgi:hypothetical protein
MARLDRGRPATDAKEEMTFGIGNAQRLIPKRSSYTAPVRSPQQFRRCSFIMARTVSVPSAYHFRPPKQGEKWDGTEAVPPYNN